MKKNYSKIVWEITSPEYKTLKKYIGCKRLYRETVFPICYYNGLYVEAEMELIRGHAACVYKVRHTASNRTHAPWMFELISNTIDAEQINISGTLTEFKKTFEKEFMKFIENSTEAQKCMNTELLFVKER